MPSLDKLQDDYAADWARMTVLEARLAAADRAAKAIASHRDRYDPVAAATRVPWFVIGLLHYREASLDFSTHLHNGDTLMKRTTHVPARRPVAGSPPFSWEDSAIDALRYDGLDGVGLWPLEVIAYRAESYNGFGPRNHGRKSGYLWGGSSIYDGGKYVADGVWSAETWDQQLGVMTILRRMLDLGLAEITARSLVSPTTPHTDEMLQRLLNIAFDGLDDWEPLVVDGSIGRITRAAVRRFQALAGLAADGIAGPLTWTALEAEAADV